MGKPLSPIVPLDSVALARELARVGREIGRGPVSKREIEHLVSVLFRCSAWLDDVYTTERLAAILAEDSGRLFEVLARQWFAASLAEDLRDPLRRLRQLPEGVRQVADQALFDLSFSSRRSVYGIGLTDLGPRAYRLAAELLRRLADDARQHPGTDAAAGPPLESMEQDAEFFQGCAARFGLYAKMLRALASPDVDLGPLPAAPDPARALPALPGPEELTPPPTAGFDDPLLALGYQATAETGPEEVARTLTSLERLLLFASLDLDRVREDLRAVVVDQDEAIATLCDDLALMAVGTQRVNKPMGYFLVGPTGVGKNYLVETLVGVFQRQWEVEVPLLTIEGPNYTYPSDINELRGATRGFIRSDEPGLLTEFHKRAVAAPLSVILVDEVEKAHPQLRRFFLSILDRGTVTDAQGQELAFDGVLIFFTSNIGYRERSPLTAPIGFGGSEEAENAYNAELSQSLRRALSPEFLNRVRLVRFRHLPRSSAERIARLEFERIARRYAALHDLELELTPAGLELLVDRGYSHEYGARRLAAVIQRSCNIEVGKMIRRDEQQLSRPDPSELLERVRRAREEEDLAGLEQLGREVLEATRARVAYRKIVVDAEDGDFVYRRES
ncbi:MAG: AAA family ATPase [Acidobacteriota bacterium]|nr:AAA family ATPase [Acidobacteriota bacterium]MDQ7087699.1 AAA family ATPase [Acidobacteriota bacterium]